MKKTFLKTGALALFLFFGLTQSASAQKGGTLTPVPTVTSNDESPNAVTVCKSVTTLSDDASIVLMKGKMTYKFFSQAKAKGAWKLEKTETVEAESAEIPTVKQFPLKSKGSHQIKVEIEVESDDAATIRIGKI